MSEDLVTHLRRLFTYDAWANREVLQSLQRIVTPPPRSVKIMAHIIAAQWLWLNRLRGEKQRLAVWPDFTVAQSQREFEELPAIWPRYLDRLHASVHYLNTKGESWTSSIHDILTHVVIHSAYHRGQIATDLRAAGFDPPYTDYIHATRQNLITAP